MYKVHHYLAIVVEGQSKMVLPFEVLCLHSARRARSVGLFAIAQHIIPRLKLLVRVYRGMRAVMYGEPEDDEGAALGAGAPSG
jgi:hypothetical protein